MGAGLAEEGDDDEPGHVEGSEEGGEGSDQEEEFVVVEGGFEDGFLGIESGGDKRDSHEGGGANHES